MDFRRVEISRVLSLRQQGGQKWWSGGRGGVGYGGAGWGVGGGGVQVVQIGHVTSKYLRDGA